MSCTARALGAITAQTKLHFFIFLLCGGHSSLEPRLPIPNRTVKRVCADDSVPFAHAKVGYRHAIFKRKSPASTEDRAFLFAKTRLLVEDRHEAAVNHALAVERHVGLVRPHPLVLHDLGPCCVARFLRWPLDPGIDDILIASRLHRAPEVRDLAFGDVIAPGLDDAGRPIFLEYRRSLGGHLAIALPVGGRHGDEIAVSVAHGSRCTLFYQRSEAAEDHALAVEWHIRAHLLHARIILHFPV